jgi:uncharacterized DUF497 family protein
MTFEWDPIKAKANLWKHGVSFEEASVALLDPFSKTALDWRPDVSKRFMKKVRHDLDDTLRAEYRRSDFGEMIQGKHATAQIEFAELVRLLLACIGEDEGLKFINHSSERQLAGHRPGDWSYQIDDANQITLRYWINELGSVEERISNTGCITTPEERLELQNLLVKHVRSLKAKVRAL